jgi:foldase protein PrsA
LVADAGSVARLLIKVCYTSLSLQNTDERIKTLKHKLLIVTLLLALALVACERIETATESPAANTPTDAPEVQVTPTVQPETEGADAPGGTDEPGGVEVALTYVDIPDQETLAVVNEEEISTALYEEELEKALSSVTAQYAVDWNDPANQGFLPSFQEQVLDQIIDRTLLRQLADEEGISASQEQVDDRITELQTQIEANPNFTDWENFLAENNLTEEEVRDLIADEIAAGMLAENHSASEAVEQVHASHILVETEETGQEVLDKLAEGEEFEALAAEYSTDPGSKDQGGDLGWFPRGMMVPEFEEAAFSLEPGQTSGLVQSDFGYHIIRVHEKAERELDPALRDQAQQQEFQSWFDAQKAAAAIERLYAFEDSE